MSLKKYQALTLASCVLFALGACSYRSSSKSEYTADEIIARVQDSQWDLVVLGDSDMWLSY